MSLRQLGMKRTPYFVILACFFLHPTHVYSGERPIVAVFDVQAKRLKLSRDMLDALTDYLASRLTETGKYQVVPRDQLKKRLMKQKGASYKQCYDQKCQIEMGRELAAEKTLATKVSKFSDVCTFTLTIYDLKKVATESAATAEGGCDEKGLLGSLKHAVQKLAGDTPSETEKPETKARSGVSKESGLDWMFSKPASIEFTKSEVTVAQYRACLEAGKCTEPKSNSDSKYCNWGHSGRDNHPINCVDWNQATAFCEWAGGRLPTEDEWYAEASNGGKRKYPWGDAEVTCDYSIWDDGNRTDGCGRDSTWPVCSKPAGNSISDLCNMSGNLWEWTSSLYKSGSSARVVRGGSWVNGFPEYSRASGRFGYAPAFRYGDGGFRCGRSVK